MKGWKRWLLISGTVLIAGGGILQGVVKPTAEGYMAPYIKEQLNTVINGQVAYESLHLNWDGTVTIQNVEVYDTSKQLVTHVNAIDVGMNLGKALVYPFIDGSAEALIGRITAHDGIIYIREVEKGLWNVTTLVKENSSNKPLAFRGTVELDHVDVKIAKWEQKQVSVQQLKGILTFKEYPSLEGAFSGEYDGRPIFVKGTYHTETHDADAFIETEQIDLVPIVRMIPDFSADLENGALKNVHVNLHKEDGRFTGDGTAQIRNLDGVYNQYTVKDGKGDIVFKGDTIHLVDGSTLLNGQYIGAHGWANIADLSKVQFDLYGHSNLFDISALDLPVKGIARGDVRIYGTIDNLKGSASVEFNDLEYNGIHAERGFVQGVYDKDVVHIQGLEAIFGSGILQGAGTYDVSTEEYNFSGKGQELPLGMANQLTSLDMSGFASGQFSLKGKGAIVHSMSAHAIAHHLGVSGVEIDSLDTLVAGGNGNYEIAYANGKAGSGDFTIYGSIGNALNLSIYGNEVPLKMIQGRVPKHIEGVVTVEARVQGSLTNPKGTIELSTSGGSYDAVTFGAGLVKARLEDSIVTIDEGKLQLSEGDAMLKGTLDYRNGGPIDVEAIVDKIRLEQVAGRFTDMPITGYATTVNHITGTLESPNVQGSLHAWDGSVYGKLFSHINVDYAWRNQNLYVDDMYINTYGALISGEGSIIDRNLDFSLKGDALNIEPWLNDLSGKISGYISLDGHVGGTIDNPNFDGSIQGSEIKINETSIYDVQARVYGDKGVLQLQEASFRGSGASSYKGSGVLGLGDSYPIKGNVSVTNGSVQHLLKLGDVELPMLDGDLNGIVDLGGSLQKPTLTVKGYIDKTRIADRILGKSEIDGSLLGRKITINKLEVPVEGGLLAAGGTADLDGAIDMQVASRDVPIEVLLPLTGKEIPLQGRMNFILNGTGSTINPKLELSAELKQGSYNGVQIDEAYILAGMENKVVHVQQAVGKKGIYALRAHGDIPIGAINPAWITNQGMSNSMNLTIDVNDADLGVLPLMFKSVKEGTGPLSGTVTLTGSANDIEAKGHIQLENGFLKVEGIQKPLDNINGQINFNGHNLDVLLKANMGKGSAGLTGNVDWNHNALESYFGGVQLDKLDMKSDYYTGPLQGELYMLDVDGIPTIKGNILVEHSTLAIPMDMDSTPGNSSLGLDVTVKAGQNVRLYNSSLYDMKIMGSATFKGTTSEPNASGKFRVTSGTLKYLNNRFKITEGFANFVSGSILPELRLQAEAMVQNYRILIAAKGPATQMNLDLSSEPHLDNRQIVSLLTFGRSESNDSGISSKDANMLLAASLQNFAFGYVENVLRNNLGLDLVNITTGALTPGKPKPEDADNFNIVIGKYIFPRFMVTYGQGLNNIKNAYGFQYEVTRKIGITAWQSSDHKSYFGGQWRTRF